MDSIWAGLDILRGKVLAQGALTYVVISLLWPLAWIAAVELGRRLKRRDRPEGEEHELPRSTASIAALAQHLASSRNSRPFVAGDGDLAAGASRSPEVPSVVHQND